MGRLGFNLVKQKEAAAADGDPATVSKHVEIGMPDQQNEKNENVEISELLLAIEERNRTIKNLRLLLVSLTTVIICLCAYIVLTQSRVLRSDQAAYTNINKLEEYSNQMQALQGQYDVMNAVKLEQARNCSQEESEHLAANEELERLLDTEKSLRSQENLEAANKYTQLQASFELLQTEHEEMGAQCMKKESEQLGQLKRLQDEKAELQRKIDASSRQQQRSQRQPTTTQRSLIDPDQLKKLNQLVKDFETGDILFDMSELIKRTDDVFRP